MPLDPAATTLRVVPMISCKDVEAALTFYRDELGFAVTDKCVEDGRLIWCWAKAGMTDVMLQYHPKQADRNGGLVIWVYVSDVDALHARLVSKGHKVSQPDTADGRRECEMADRDGNPIILCQVMSADPAAAESAA